jgi:hypothetical protein
LHHQLGGHLALAHADFDERQGRFERPLGDVNRFLHQGQFVRILSENPKERAGWRAGARPIRLVEADWEPSLDPGASTFEFTTPGEVLLSVPKGKGTGTYGITRKPLLGDFDVSVRVEFLEWDPILEVALQAALMAARPDENFRRQAYIIERNVSVQPDETVQDLLLPWTIQEGEPALLPGKPTPKATASFRLRLVRRSGVLTASYDIEEDNDSDRDRRPPRWVQAVQFESPCSEPLHLILAVGNSPSEDKEVEHPAVRARFSELTVRP